MLKPSLPSDIEPLSKVNDDLIKLFREAKDNLDDCIQPLLNDKAAGPFSWFLQANGLHAHLGTVHLAEPGLYAAIHQGIIHFPWNLASFHEFKKPLALLFMVTFDLKQNATMIRKSIGCIDDCSSTIGGQSTVQIRGWRAADWQRPQDQLTTTLPLMTLNLLIFLRYCLVRYLQILLHVLLVDLVPLLLTVPMNMNGYLRMANSIIYIPRPLQTGTLS